MNEVGERCYPSVATLMNDTGLSNRAVLTHIAKAVEAGWLFIGQHGFTGQKWRGTSTALVGLKVKVVHHVARKVVNVTLMEVNVATKRW